MSFSQYWRKLLMAAERRPGFKLKNMRDSLVGNSLSQQRKLTPIDEFVARIGRDERP